MKPGVLKRIAQRSLLLLLGLSLALLLAEGVCKIIDVKTAVSHRQATHKISRLSSDPDIRYELIPNVEANTPGQRAMVRVNNLGFRGGDVAKRKAPGRYRIAVVGDSIAFGRTYPQENVFPSVLERELNAADLGRKVEVINASLSGRDTWEEAAVIERRVLPLDPDLVVLQICMNDHVRLPKPKSAGGAFGERSWYSYSSLLKLLDRRVDGFREMHVDWLKRLGMDARTWEQILLDQMITVGEAIDVERDWPSWGAELARIADRVRGDGARVLFVVFPLDWQIKQGMPSTLPELVALAREHDIPLVDMMSAFSKNPGEMLIDYTHPSRAGHAVVGRELGEVIGPWIELSAAE